jgi:ribulose-phosphate 3-epimerase
MPIIAPSLLSANFLKLQDECNMLNKSDGDWFHLDVMDGQFVPNISYGFPIIKQIRTVTQKFLDLHLMILEPEKFTERFKDIGADSITVHAEACTHLHRNIEQIKSLGMKASVALNPHTPVSVIENVLADVDMVLIMSVNPGFGAQKFIPISLYKTQQLRKMIDERGLKVLIEVDGGITLENAPSIIKAGADVLVAGNTIFKSANPALTIKQLKSIQID